MQEFCPLLPSRDIANEEKIHEGELAPDERIFYQKDAVKIDSDH